MTQFNPGIQPCLRLYDAVDNTRSTLTIWGWDFDLRVTENTLEELPLSFKETDYACSFFGADGQLSAWITPYLDDHWTQWAEQIPMAYRQAVGKLSGQDPRFSQLMLLRLMKWHPHFAQWLINLAETQGGAYLKFVMTLASFAKLALPLKETFLLSLVGQERHTFLMRLSGVPVKSADLKFIYKLALMDNLWTLYDAKNFLWLLAENEQDVKSVLSQTKQLNLNTVKKILQWPRWLWLGSIWSAVAELDELQIERVVPPLILEAEGNIQNQMLKTLAKVTTYDALEEVLAKLATTFAKVAIFDKPPLAGSLYLTPITTGKGLVDEGKSMQHCVAGYVDWVLKGQSYFYHWHGDENFPMPLTIELSPFPKSSQWKVVEALGVKNKLPTPEQYDYLTQHLANLNPPWGYLLVKTDVVGLNYYDLSEVYRSLETWQTLKIEAKPDNEFDPHAVAVYTPEGVKLGFIPKSENHKIHQTWSKNWQLTCRLNYLDFTRPRLTVNVYLAPEKE
ncbi:HIRAN domain-containing protein [Thiomicrospira microaerophila]|uniref:HIRAN domain-containing protein n=1 Tax=Thiomicrospira microaerophila TaxID=406020 RepID=UPI0005C97E37|nr:HIRAN domain-containing protein [Thiomicrospira microaerophila]